MLLLRQVSGSTEYYLHIYAEQHLTVRAETCLQVTSLWGCVIPEFADDVSRPEEDSFTELLHGGT